MSKRWHGGWRDVACARRACVAAARPEGHCNQRAPGRPTGASLPGRASASGAAQKSGVLDARLAALPPCQVAASPCGIQHGHAEKTMAFKAVPSRRSRCGLRPTRPTRPSRPSPQARSEIEERRRRWQSVVSHDTRAGRSRARSSGGAAATPGAGVVGARIAVGAGAHLCDAGRDRCRSADLLAKGLALVHETDHLPARLRCDATRLLQALINLPGNAVECTDRGRVRLRGEPLQDDGQRLQVRFEVRGTGAGFTRAPARLCNTSAATGSAVRRCPSRSICRRRLHHRHGSGRA